VAVPGGGHRPVLTPGGRLVDGATAEKYAGLRRATDGAVEPSATERAMIHHSDRGVQYASGAFGRLLASHGIAGSRSRKGDCWDNAVVENCFGSLKSERIHWRNYHRREEARKDLVEYLTRFYNRQRLHAYLGYQSPDRFERNGQRANVA
jgi:transposase InsO family protein